MTWIEISPGHWTSDAGSVDVSDGEIKCFAVDVGLVRVEPGCSIIDAEKAVEIARAEYLAGMPQGHEAGSAPGRRGRKPKGARPMTAAERQAARMERMRRKVASAVSTVQQLGNMPLDPSTQISLAEIWNRHRIEIRQWLEKQAPPLAGVYQEAVNLIHMPESPTRLYFVAHGVREIGNRLPEFLDEISSERVLYEKLVGPISTSWEQSGLPIGDDPFPVLVDGSQVPGETQIKIPVELARYIATLLKKHSEGGTRSKKRSVVLFDAIKKEAGISTGGAQSAVERWETIREWAVKNAHVGLQEPTCSYAEMREHFADFERILHALVGGFVGVLSDIDEILTTAPSTENIDAAMALLSRGGARNYFFGHVNDPEWLRLLDENGYFDALRQGEHWPEFAFLTRMANSDPERVTQIVERLTKAPDTIVRFYLIAIAIALPPSHAARLTEAIAKIVADKRRHLNFWHNLSELIVRLADGNEGDAAFQLFDAMYSTQRAKTADSSEKISFPDTSTDLWWLQEGLKSIQPALLKVDAKKLVQALCSKLKNALTARGYLGSNLDHSYIAGWHLSTTDGDGAASDIVCDLESLFAKSIVQTATMAVRSGFIAAAEARTLIERKQGTIFQLISLYVLASIAPGAREQAIEIMIKPMKFEDTNFEGPYAQILHSRFAELSPEERESVLGWIRKGPDLGIVTPRWETVYGGKPTAEQWEIFRKGWTRRWLNRIPMEYLPAADMDILTRITADLAPEQDKWTVFGVEASPKTQEELQSMSPDEMAEFLKFNPPGNGRGPTSELTTLLPQVVQEQVAEFSSSAKAFIGVHQSWVRSLLWGFNNSAKKGAAIDWEPLLALCAWVVEQPRGEEPRDVVGNGDVSWEGARGAIADIIRTGLQNSKASIPAALGTVVWAILEQLAEDPDPTIEYENGHTFEPAMLSINSVRGKAMHAVIQYALWHRRRMNDEGITGGFETMPEVRALLDVHLDQERDPSPAVRSVYAQYFPALVYLDAEWATAVASKVFPASEEHMRYWRASWSVYSTFAQTFDQVFDILRSTYELAAQRMPWSENVDTPRSADGEDWRYAEENIACHLIAFYWRGKLGMESDGLLVRFFAQCTPRSRSKALWFIANSLASHEGDVTADIQQRLMTLWEWRMKAARDSNDPEDRKELATFGGWFAYGKLDPDWSSRTLIEVLKLHQDIDHPGMVIGRIAAIAHMDLKRAIECLQAFVAADREGWRHTMAKDHLEATLLSALNADQPEIARTARGIIDKLAERGDLSYRALVTTPREATI